MTTSYPARPSFDTVSESKELRQMLREESRQRDNRFPANFSWFGGGQEAMSEEGRLAWYDSRANKPRAAERRLYYQTNGVTSLMRPGDTLFLARRRDDQLFFIVTPEGSTIESQLLWRSEEHTAELQH